MNFLYRIMSGVRAVVGVILPVFSKAGDFRNWPSAVWMLLHLFLLAAVLAGLTWANYHFDFATLLKEKANDLPPVGKDYLFLPLVFLLGYASIWVGWWIWRLLFPGEEASSFPDIDRDWDEAVRALGSQGITLDSAPLFLVLGRPASGAENLFKASGLNFNVGPAPKRSDATLQVWANRDAIYVHLLDTSLTGRLCERLASGGAPAGPGPLASQQGGMPSIGMASIGMASIGLP